MAAAESVDYSFKSKIHIEWLFVPYTVSYLMVYLVRAWCYTWIYLWAAVSPAIICKSSARLPRFSRGYVYVYVENMSHP